MDEVTNMELEEGKLVKLGSTLEGENPFMVVSPQSCGSPQKPYIHFVYKLEDVTEINSIIITHKLNVNPSIKPIK